MSNGGAMAAAKAAVEVADVAKPEIMGDRADFPVSA